MTAKPKSGINRGGGAGGGKGGGGAGGANIEDAINKMVQADPDRMFYRIPTLRAVMRENGMSDAEFNKQIDNLWTQDAIALHTGDVKHMTLQEAKDRYTDSNGFVFGTFTLSSGWKQRKRK